MKISFHESPKRGNVGFAIVTCPERNIPIWANKDRTTLTCVDAEQLRPCFINIPNIFFVFNVGYLKPESRLLSRFLCHSFPFNSAVTVVSE